MIKWKNFDKWAKKQGYTFQVQGTGDEVIVGVGSGGPIATGRHNHRDGVPDRLLLEIASRLGIKKYALEEQI